MSTNPLLPAWSTDATVAKASQDLFKEIVYHLIVREQIINHRVQVDAPVLVDEATAYLKHIAEGWFSQ